MAVGYEILWRIDVHANALRYTHKHKHTLAHSLIGPAVKPMFLSCWCCRNTIPSLGFISFARSFIADFYWIFHFSFIMMIWLNSAWPSCLTVSDGARQCTQHKLRVDADDIRMFALHKSILSSIYRKWERIPFGVCVSECVRCFKSNYRLWLLVSRHYHCFCSTASHQCAFHLADSCLETCQE